MYIASMAAMYATGSFHNPSITPIIRLARFSPCTSSLFRHRALNLQLKSKTTQKFGRNEEHSTLYRLLLC